MFLSGNKQMILGIAVVLAVAPFSTASAQKLPTGGKGGPKFGATSVGKPVVETEAAKTLREQRELRDRNGLPESAKDHAQRTWALREASETFKVSSETIEKALKVVAQQDANEHAALGVLLSKSRRELKPGMEKVLKSYLELLEFGAVNNFAIMPRDLEVVESRFDSTAKANLAELMSRTAEKMKTGLFATIQDAWEGVLKEVKLLEEFKKNCEKPKKGIKKPGTFDSP